MKGELTFKGSNKAVKILEMDFSFDQQYDVIAGRTPNGDVTGGVISLTLEMSKESGMILQWAIGALDMKDGKITVYVKDNIKREITFTDAYCVHYDESFNYRGGDEPLSYRIAILPSELKLESQGVIVEYKINRFHKGN